jgi:hypothetical protein
MPKKRAKSRDHDQPQLQAPHNSIDDALCTHIAKQMDSSSMTNACNRYFEASQKIPLVCLSHTMSFFLLHWDILDSLVETLPPLPCKSIHGFNSCRIDHAKVVVMCINMSSICKHPHHSRTDEEPSTLKTYFFITK